MTSVYTIAVCLSDPIYCDLGLLTRCSQTTRIVLNLCANYNDNNCPAHPSDVELPEWISFAQRATDFTVEEHVRLGNPDYI